MEDFHVHTFPAVAAPANAAEITFDNRGDRLISLGFLNGFLKLITLGLYSFWAKTEVRRRLWSFTRINGEPLQYTGTGKELFLGFLVVFFLFVLPVILAGTGVALFFPGSVTALTLYKVAVYALFFFLLGNAMYRAQRYRLSRTQWRGIRGSLDGSPWSYGWTYFWTLALPALLSAGAAGALTDWASYAKLAAMPPGMREFGVPAFFMQNKLAVAALILGAIAIALILPWRSNKLQRQITNEMSLGNAPLSYTGSATPLYKNYFLAAAGGVLLLVLASAATAALSYKRIGESGETVPFEPGQAAAFAIVAIWIGFFIALAVISAWYRANQVNHFARHTHFGEARFRAEASGPGLVWLALSNWLLIVVSTAIAVAIGLGAAFGLNMMPIPGSTQPPGPALTLIIILPMILTTTAATTYAQFRSARYFMSRLKLDGKVDFNAILQSAGTGPTRGEGLAQVFDLDAF